MKKEGIENFSERLNKELNKINIDKKIKKCIKAMIMMELNYPTTDRDANGRYEQIIRGIKKE